MNATLRTYFLLAVWFCIGSQPLTVIAHDNATSTFNGNLILTTQTEVNAFHYKKITGDLKIGNQSNVESNPPITDLTPLKELTSVCEADCSGEVTLSTQAQVDAFTCTSVGSLFIDANGSGSDPITNLKALCTLVHITDDLTISDNGETQLSTLEGLHGLTTIGGTLSVTASGVKNFEGLKALTSVASLSISDAGLESFRGLDNLQAIRSDLRITTTYGLTDFRGLENLQRIAGVIDLVDARIASYEGLTNLETVGGFDYSESFEVDDFVGLASLKTITGDIILDGEESGITSFKGLDNVENIGAIRMRSSYVTTFEGLGNLQKIGSIDVEISELVSFEGIGPVAVENNLSVVGGGFDTDDFVDPSALVNIQRIGGNLILTNNANLSDCCILPSLQANVEGSIILSNNAEDCNSLEAIEERCDEPIVDCGGDITLTTQAEVNAFDCTSVESLTIDANPNNNDPITNLKALCSLVTIRKDLAIRVESAQVASLEGLHNLKTIGGDFTYFGNLPNLAGLEKLKSIGGSFVVEYQAGLNNFVGLEALETIGGDLLILYNTLENFKGLSNLKTIGGSITVRFGLTDVSFEGLSALESVGGFVIEENNVENFVGLSSLKTINGSIVSQGTDGGIGSFEGLENVEEIAGSIALAFNANFVGWEGLRNLRRIGGDLSLEQYSFETFDGLEKLEEISGQLYLLNNGITSLQAFSSLRSVGSVLIESEPITSLDGLEQLRQVSNNFSLLATQIADISALQDIERIGGDLRFTFNGQLSECCIIPSLLERVQGEVTIENNAEGCNSLPEIEEACEEEASKEENARIAGKDILTYPNPTVNFVQIHTDQPLSIGVYNTAGYLMNEQWVDQEGVINMASLPAGIYLLKANGKTVQRIIKE